MKQKKPPPTYGDRESLGLRQDEQKNRCPLLVALGPYNYQGDFFSVWSKQFFQYQRMKLETLAGQASDLLYTYDIYTHMIYMYIYVYIHFAFIFYFETGSYQVAQVGLELIVYYHSNLTMLIK